MSQFIERIRQSIFGTKLSREAFEAYFYRLPDSIQVDWKRDGKYIIGRVSDGKHEFVTQGRDSEEFIKMVNDALITVYEIPTAYINVLKKAHRTYEPNPQEKKKLEDASVTHSIFSFRRRDEVLQTA